METYGERDTLATVRGYRGLWSDESVFRGPVLVLRHNLDVPDTHDSSNDDKTPSSSSFGCRPVSFCSDPGRDLKAFLHCTCCCSPSLIYSKAAPKKYQTEKKFANAKETRKKQG